MPVPARNRIKWPCESTAGLATNCCATRRGTSSTSRPALRPHSAEFPLGRFPGEGGMIDVPQLRGKVRSGDQHLACTRLVCLENTTNVGGGRAYPLEQIARVGAWAHELGLKVHVDGARLFNAVVARGYSPKDVGKHVDTISVCFSKGLGCPMGSILVGSAEEIRRGAPGEKAVWRRAAASGNRGGRRNLRAGAQRRAVGGGPSERPAARRIDCRHTAASRFGSRLWKQIWSFLRSTPHWATPASFRRRSESRGVRIHDTDAQRLRACTHLDVRREDIPEVARILRECVQKGFRDLPGSPIGPYARG